MRRGAMILLPSGAPEISEPSAAPLEPDEIEVVEAEIDRQRIQMSLLREAVGNDKSPDDYAAMVTKARGLYGLWSRPPGKLRRLARRMLALYGLLCYGVAMAYHSQDRLLRSGE